MTHHINFVLIHHNASAQQEGKHELVLLKQAAAHVAVQAEGEKLNDVGDPLIHFVCQTHVKIKSQCKQVNVFYMWINVLHSLAIRSVSPAVSESAMLAMKMPRNHSSEYWYIGSTLHRSDTQKKRICVRTATGTYSRRVASMSCSVCSAAITLACEYAKFALAEKNICDRHFRTLCMATDSKMSHLDLSSFNLGSPQHLDELLIVHRVTLSGAESE